MEENKDNPGFKDSLKDKTILLFDDGSYSGLQISEHVSSIFKALIENGFCDDPQKKVKAIAVVVPFRTLTADQLIAAEIQKIPAKHLAKGPQIVLSTCEVMDTLADLTSPTKTTLAKMWYGGDESCLKSYGLSWHQHKVPNDQSFPAAIANGGVYKYEAKKKQYSSLDKSFVIIPEVKSPYKQMDLSDLLGSNIPNFHECWKGMFRGGKPKSDAGYEFLKKEKQITSIINLREGSKDDRPLDRFGFQVTNIEMDPSRPSKGQVIQFMDVITRDPAENHFVHCFHGSDRTGMMIGIAEGFKKMREGVSEDDAIKQALGNMMHPKYGFHRLTHSHLLTFAQGILKDKELQEKYGKI